MTCRESAGCSAGSSAARPALSEPGCDRAGPRWRDQLLDAGATVIVIDHDLDLLAAADHLIDMGPGGGPDGGRILAAGTPGDVARDAGSVTGPWLAEYLGLPG